MSGDSIKTFRLTASTMIKIEHYVPTAFFCIRTISDPCEANPCATGYTCSYSSTPVNENYYRCTGTSDTVPLFKNNRLSDQKISVQKTEMVENNLVQLACTCFISFLC